MGGGGYRMVDDMPYFYHRPGWGYNDPYGAASPWGTAGVRRSPYYSSEQAGPRAVPYARSASVYPTPVVASEYGGHRRGRQPEPSRAKQPAVRKIVVTDGKKSATKQAAKTESRAEGELVQQVRKKPRFESEDAAATFVMSWYRGYQVRRTEPLKHLKVIKQVVEKLRELREQACSPQFLQKMREMDLERLRYNETIMSLLLKLDSLQGVHSFVREVRKAVTRDLVRLQDATEAALASGTCLTPDDLLPVQTPVNTTDEEVVDMVDEAEDEGCGNDDVVGVEATAPLATEELMETDGVASSCADEGMEGRETSEACEDVPLWELTGTSVQEVDASRRHDGEMGMVEDGEHVTVSGARCGQEAAEREDARVSDLERMEAGNGACAAADKDVAVEGRWDEVSAVVDNEECAQLGTSTGVDLELPSLNNNKNNKESGSVGAFSGEDGGVIVDAASSPDNGVETERDRKRKLDAQDSNGEILQWLMRENQSLKEVLEKVMQQQAVSMCNLGERLERLEERLRRQERKGAKCRSRKPKQHMPDDSLL